MCAYVRAQFYPIFHYEVDFEILAVQHKWGPFEMSICITQENLHQGKFSQTILICSVNLKKKFI